MERLYKLLPSSGFLNGAWRDIGGGEAEKSFVLIETTAPYLY